MHVLDNNTRGAIDWMKKAKIAWSLIVLGIGVGVFLVVTITSFPSLEIWPWVDADEFMQIA
jgi:hypothetical protein